MKKVIIMKVAFGGGHAAMARNIQDALADSPEPVEVETIDVVADAWPKFSQATSRAYAGSAGTAGGFWFRLYYKITDRFPQPLGWFCNAMFRSYALKTYQTKQPDLIIATFPFTGDLAVWAREKSGGHAPVIVTVTDAGRVQGIWLTNKVDRILTATPDTIEYMVSRGIDRERLDYIGFPASKSLYESYDQAEARRRIGLDPDTFTILVTAGGAGLNPDKVIAVAEAIAKIEMPYQIVLNAGVNEELKGRFERLSFPSATHVIVNGFVNPLDNYLRSADVICTKAGWLTVNEAIVLQKLLVLYDAVPGHEEQNVRYVVDHGYGVFAPEPEAAADQIRQFIASPEARLPLYDSLQMNHTNRSPYDRLRALLLGYLSEPHQ